MGATNWSGGRAATRHLTERGHRRIAMISGPRDVLCCCARPDGYRSALGTAGLPADPGYVVHADLTHEGGRAAAHALLVRPDLTEMAVAATELALTPRARLEIATTLTVRAGTAPPTS